MNNEQLNNLNCSLLGLAASAKALAQLASECREETKPVAPRQVVLQWCEKHMYGEPWAQTPEGCTLPHGWVWAGGIHDHRAYLYNSEGGTVNFDEANDYCMRAKAGPAPTSEQPKAPKPADLYLTREQAINHMRGAGWPAAAWGEMPDELLPRGWGWVKSAGVNKRALAAVMPLRAPCIRKEHVYPEPVKPTRCMSRESMLEVLARMTSWSAGALPAGWQRRTVHGNVYVVCVEHKEYITYNDWVIARNPSLLWG